MLQLSANATTAIRGLMDRPERPDISGLRIAGDQEGSGQLSVSTAGMPEEGDQVVENRGARVFLEPDVAPLLDDKVLDATVDEQGRVAFSLGSQPGSP
jgi:iron-sulfur cluster assembly protein